MFVQVRTYTVNKGQMDEWIKTFNSTVVPGHEKAGIKIIGAWVNKARNQFHWVRVFESEEDMTAKMKAFNETPERQAAGPGMTAVLARLDVADCEEQVFPPLS